MTQHYVSPSALGEFRKCPKCFWWDRNKKVKKPRGAFPTLPGGFDRILKTYFDEHRVQGTLPPEIADALPGDGEGFKLYPDTERLAKMRNALRPVLTTTIGNVKLAGGIDDLLVDAQARVYPFDAKTKGRAIDTSADPFLYYRMQLNDYGLLLQAAGFTLGGWGYLGYWSPVAVMSRKVFVEQVAREHLYNTAVQMRCQVFGMELDVTAATAEVIAAGKCLDGEEPEAAADCEMCQFIEKRGGPAVLHRSY